MYIYTSRMIGHNIPVGLTEGHEYVGEVVETGAASKDLRLLHAVEKRRWHFGGYCSVFWGVVPKARYSARVVVIAPEQAVPPHIVKCCLTHGLPVGQLVDRAQSDNLYDKSVQIPKLAFYAVQITDSVAAAVHEAARINLINNLIVPSLSFHNVLLQKLTVFI